MKNIFKNLELSLLEGKYAIWKLKPNGEFPIEILAGQFAAFIKTTDELSVVCEEKYLKQNAQAEINWKCMKVIGSLSFELIGILNSLTAPLAEAEISLFAVSTYDTDYILVKEKQLAEAIRVLSEAGHRVLVN
jgi:uncharacterized protein